MEPFHLPLPPFHSERCDALQQFSLIKLGPFIISPMISRHQNSARIRVEPVIVDMADANFTCPDGFAPGTSTCTSVDLGGG